MVRVSRPIWISRINRRMSFKKFRENITMIKQLNQDYSRVLKSAKNQLKDVYEVTVETWSDGEKSIWVGEELAEVTGEMYTRFMEQQVMNIEDYSDLDDTIENEGTFSEFIAIEEQENGIDEKSDDGENSGDDACDLSTIDCGEPLDETLVQEVEDKNENGKDSDDDNDDDEYLSSSSF